MKYTDLLASIRIAGYHNDEAAYTRLIIENRIGRDAARTQYMRGQDMKQAGVKCTCTTCNPNAK